MKTTDCAIFEFDGSENFSGIQGGYYSSHDLWAAVTDSWARYKEVLGEKRYKLFIYDDYSATLALCDGDNVLKAWDLKDSGEFQADDRTREFYFTFNAVSDDCPIESLVLYMDYPDDDEEWLSAHRGIDKDEDEEEYEPATAEECCEYFCEQVKNGICPRVSEVCWRDDDLWML